MTATPPDPAPEHTPGLEPGGGVAPGDTPPDSGQTSGLSHPQPQQRRTFAVVSLVVIALITVAIAAFFLVYAFTLNN